MNIIFLEDGVKKAHLTKNLQELERLMNHPTQVSNLAKARNGDNAAKKQLIQANFSAYLEEGQLLKGAKTPSHLCAIDIDFDPKSELTEEQMQVKETVQAWYKHKRDELIAKVMECADVIGLVMCEVSPRGHGLHIVFLRVRDLSQIQNLDMVSEILGVPYDKNAKDITRVFYMTSMKDMYIHNPEALFAHEAFPIVEEPVVKVQAQKIQSAAVDAKVFKLNKTEMIKENDNAPVIGTTADGVLMVKGVPASKVMEMFLARFYPNGVEEGNRNNAIHKTSRFAGNIGYDEQTALEVVPNFFGNTEEGIKEWKQTVINGVRYGRAQEIGYIANQIISELKGGNAMERFGGTTTCPPEMPENLPEVLAWAVSKLQPHLHPCVCGAVLSALGAHLGNVSIRLWTGEVREPALMVAIIAPQGSGKSFVEKPIEAVMADLVEEDDKYYKLEQEWRAKLRKNRNKNKEMEERPKGCIRFLAQDVSAAKLNLRFEDAELCGNKTLMYYTPECENVRKLTEHRSNAEVSELIRLCYDRARGGQDRVGADSVMCRCKYKMNMVVSGTPTSARKMFGQNCGDGANSRLDIYTITQLPKGQKLKVGDYDQAYIDGFKKYQDLLNQADGLIECPEAIAMGEQLSEKYERIADELDSDVVRNLSRRTLLISMYKAIILYICNNYQWNEEIANFFDWSMSYGMWTKLFFFGKEFEKSFEADKAYTAKSGKKSLYYQLPLCFTKEEFLQMGGTESQFKNWKNRDGKIKWEDTVEAYVKLK